MRLTLMFTQRMKVKVNELINLGQSDQAKPTETTAPTLQCVVETGRPSIDAARTVNALARSITKPRDGVSSKLTVGN